jgi:hypothetical protein
MTKYYVHNGTRQLGPFNLIELKGQNLSKLTPIWFEGQGDWRPLEQIPELLEVITTPPAFIKNTPPAFGKVEDDNAPFFNKAPNNKLKFPLIVASFITIVLIGWLVYANTSNAAIIDEVQQEQQTQDRLKAQQEDDRRKLNAELTQKNMNYRNNWAKFIEVDHGGYRSNSLGGIYNLEVVVTNHTDYILDEVEAHVTYIKSNGSTWKTITVPVTNVLAHTKKSVPVEDVERCTSVEVSVNTVLSKKMHFFYSEGYSSGNRYDPYFFSDKQELVDF